MFCKHCGKQINSEDKFCPHCGDLVQVDGSSEAKPATRQEEAKIKTYSSSFWKYFGILILINIIIGIFQALGTSIYWMIVLVGYVYFFCKMVNEAMLSIGKKNWWPLGLLVVIPLGFWIVFFSVRSQLKSRGKWSIKGERISPFIIIVIVFISLAIIGILASIVLVSLGSAREKARDAVRQSDIRQIATTLELYYLDSDKYVVSISGSPIPNTVKYALNSYIEVPDDPLGSEYGYTWVGNTSGCGYGHEGKCFCVYAKLEGETDYPIFAANETGTALLEEAPTSPLCFELID